MENKRENCKNCQFENGEHSLICSQYSEVRHPCPDDFSPQPQKESLELKILDILPQNATEKTLNQLLSFISAELQRARQEERSRVLGEVIQEIEKMKQKHEIDMELYNDTGGGEMCIYCGKQGYLDRKESCEDNQVERNQALSEVASIIKKLGE